MSRSKHLYQVVLVKVHNNELIDVHMNLWANSKRDLYQICKERYSDLIPFEARYIK